MAYYERRHHEPFVVLEGFVEFGISLPGRGPLAKPDQVLAIAAKADALGYASIFVTDHVVLPASMGRSVYPYSSTGQLPGGAAQDYLDPLAMLGALSRATRRARLGTSVLVVPYRHPLVTAKILATLDQISGGRVILGAGVGWLREEFEAVGAPPFEERGAVTDEYLRFMRATWTTDPVNFTGRYVSVRDVHALPKPVQAGGLPVWIGGHTDAAVRRAATLGDGWHPIALRPPGLLFPDAYARRAQQLQTWAREAGRDPGAITLSVRVPMEVRPRRVKPPAGERPLFQGTAEEVMADIRAYAAAGVTHFVWDFTTQDRRLVVDNLERFVQEVRPKLAGRSRAQTIGAGAARSGKSARGRARSGKAAGALARGARGSAGAGAARSGKTAGGLARGARGSARTRKAGR